MLNKSEKQSCDRYVSSTDYENEQKNLFVELTSFFLLLRETSKLIN